MSSFSFSLFRSASASASRAARLTALSNASTAFFFFSPGSMSQRESTLMMALSRSLTLAARRLMPRARAPDALSRCSLFLASHCHKPSPTRSSAFFQSTLSRALTDLLTGSADFRSSISANEARIVSSDGLEAASNKGQILDTSSPSVILCPTARKHSLLSEYLVGSVPASESRSTSGARRPLDLSACASASN